MFRSRLSLSRPFTYAFAAHHQTFVERRVFNRVLVPSSAVVLHQNRSVSVDYQGSRKSSKHGSNGSREAGKRKSVGDQSTLRNEPLRSAAVEAGRSRVSNRKANYGKKIVAGRDADAKLVTAYCAAEQYRLSNVLQALERAGYTIDPYQTNLYPQVVHVRMAPAVNSKGNDLDTSSGDIFIFPAGTVVAWDVNEETVMFLMYTTLLPAAENAHVQTELETEDLEFTEDHETSASRVVGDKISLGTAPQAAAALNQKESPDQSTTQHETDLVLTKIAFSSGLSRSVKLAVLENKLEAYVQSTRSIPPQLARGQRLPFTRSFVLRKTGELLEARAQLNLNNELTDALPDMFWDSRHELGLEGCFEAVGRALDVGVRTRDLNRKMTYAQEIVSVLREQLAERHGYALEWLIIALISIEVGFEVLRLWKEREREAGVAGGISGAASEEDAALLRIYLGTVLDKVLKGGEDGDRSAGQ